MIQSTIDNKERKSVKKKRQLASEEQQFFAPPTKQVKIDVNGLINGSGIFID